MLRLVAKRLGVQKVRPQAERARPSTNGFRRGSISDVPAGERCLTPAHEAFYTSPKTINKWRHYFTIYDRHLAKFRNKPARILEIGVFKGGSLLMWRRYFGEEAIIFGIDIDPACAEHDGDGGQVRIGSQDDPQFLRSVVAEMGGIDVVLNDGSHVAHHQLASFSTLFPMLDAHGLYICEDTHTAYWSDWGGGYRRPDTFIEFAKQMIDDLHAQFHDHGGSIVDAKSVASVHFYNSVVVIEKDPQVSAVPLMNA